MEKAIALVETLMRTAPGLLAARCVAAYAFGSVYVPTDRKGSLVPTLVPSGR